MSTNYTFHPISPENIEKIRENEFLYWLLLEDSEYYEEETGEVPPADFKVSSREGSVLIDDWNIKTVDWVKEVLDSRYPRIIKSLEQLSYQFGEDCGDGVDFGFGPIAIITYEQVVTALDNLSEITEGSSLEGKVEDIKFIGDWLIELKSALQEVLNSKFGLIRKLG
ncbi:hypothetical protein [Microbulbifer sp. JMSA002]|uniref:hypothetical protein n=1 Tax=Microbulbifer sp. JMSA002 TaxID=3243368 RepID=UPI0040399A59